MKLKYSLLLFTFLILLLNALYAQNFKEVKIGSQTWMSKNLNVNKFRNGDVIREAKTQEEWDNAGKAQKPIWCYYKFDRKNELKYGKLYNWYAVNDKRGLAPIGWRVSSDRDWTLLSDYLGGDDVSGWKLKSTKSWSNYNKSIGSYNEHQMKMGKKLHGRDSLISTGFNTNTSKFNAVAGGSNGLMYDNDYGYWWCSNEINDSTAKAINFVYFFGDIRREGYLKIHGFSVRCVKEKNRYL
jgi:uncharacterized protein (TIGR02145 family)